MGMPDLNASATIVKSLKPPDLPRAHAAQSSTLSFTQASASRPKIHAVHSDVPVYSKPTAPQVLLQQIADALKR